MSFWYLSFSENPSSSAGTTHKDTYFTYVIDSVLDFWKQGKAFAGAGFVHLHLLLGIPSLEYSGPLITNSFRAGLGRMEGSGARSMLATSSTSSGPVTHLTRLQDGTTCTITTTRWRLSRTRPTSPRHISPRFEGSTVPLRSELLPSDTFGRLTHTPLVFHLLNILWNIEGKNPSGLCPRFLFRL